MCTKTLAKNPDPPLQKYRTHYHYLLRQLSIYVVFTGMGVAAVWRQPWALDARLLWKGWPRHELT
jgi:hypothetical protein